MPARSVASELRERSDDGHPGGGSVGFVRFHRSKWLRSGISTKRTQQGRNGFDSARRPNEAIIAEVGLFSGFDETKPLWDLWARGSQVVKSLIAEICELLAAIQGCLSGCVARRSHPGRSGLVLPFRQNEPIFRRAGYSFRIWRSFEIKNCKSQDCKSQRIEGSWLLIFCDLQSCDLQSEPPDSKATPAPRIVRAKLSELF